MGESLNSTRNRKKKEFQIIRNFNGNLKVEEYLIKIIKEHMDKCKSDIREEKHNG